MVESRKKLVKEEHLYIPQQKPLSARRNIVTQHSNADVQQKMQSSISVLAHLISDSGLEHYKVEQIVHKAQIDDLSSELRTLAMFLRDTKINTSPRTSGIKSLDPAVAV